MKLVIHGGAGNFDPSAIDVALREERVHALYAALEAGREVLQGGGSAVDAVETAVVVLEECPHFNAGRGAVFTSTGAHSLDAAIADGDLRRCGGVIGLTRVRNPVRAARAVMETSPHVLLAGEGAELLAQASGLEPVEVDFFSTEERRKQWLLARNGEAQMDHDIEGQKRGTVGAVALDARGRLAAATSTGGMTNVSAGRVSDSAIIGAGTWADRAVAISCTGHGEPFIRTGAAHEVSARYRLGGQVLERACQGVLDDVAALGGFGGIIGVTSRGATVLARNTTGMYRGLWNGKSNQVGIGDEWES